MGNVWLQCIAGNFLTKHENIAFDITAISGVAGTF